MKNKRTILFTFICCFWLSSMCLLWTQIAPATSNAYPSEDYEPTQAEIVLADIKMNRMCHIAADFGYDAAKRGDSKEQMHQELGEILK